MKGAKLNIRILTGIAVALGLLMAILNIYPSWSQFAGTAEDPLLYSALFCISSIFMISSFSSENRDREITKIWLINSLSLGQCYRLVAYLFGGVITFSVNSQESIVEIAHLVFTGAAILFGYVALMTYPETKKGHLWALIGTIFGVGGFLLAFLFNVYSTAWGEVLAAIPLAAFVNLTFDKK